MSIEDKTLDQLRAEEAAFVAARAARFGAVEKFEITDKEKAMWERIQSAEATEIGEINKRLDQLYRRAGDRFEKELKITPEQGKDIMKEVLKGHGFTGKNYCLTGTNSAWVLNQLIAWTVYDTQNCELDTRKGICLWGDVGRGKTQMLKFFQSFCQALGFREFGLVHTKGIVIDISEKKDLSPLKKYLKGKWAFNDIGTEEDDRLFSNKIDVVDRVFTIRADDELLTHATTNVPPQAWGDVYGKRVASRSQQLFNFVEMKGPWDFRADDWKKSINP